MLRLQHEAGQECADPGGVVRTYTVEERAEAVALSASIGPLKAAKQLGYPPRTVASWGHKPAAAPIIAEANRTIAERLREAHSEALAAVLVGVRDPRSRLADRAAALRTLGEQLALAEGRATANVDLHSTSTDAPELTDAERSELLVGLAQEIAAYQAAHPDEDFGGIE